MTKHEIDEFLEENQHIERIMRHAFKLPDSFCYRLPPQKISAEELRSCSFEKISETPGGEVFSSVHGQIRQMLVTYPIYSPGELIYKNTLTDLLKKMSGVDFFVYTECPPGTVHVARRYAHVKAHLEEMQRNFEKNGRKIQFIYSRYNHFSCWVRDPFLMGYTHSDTDGKVKSVCIEPNEFIRESNVELTGPTVTDAQIADEIVMQRAHQFSLLNSPLIFHGGNVLVGDNFMLIGKDYFNMERKVRKQLISKKETLQKAMSLSLKPHDIKCDFQHWLSPKDQKRIILLGKKRPENFKMPALDQYNRDVFSRCPIGNRQPFFHLDLFLTLAGRQSEGGAYRVLVSRIENASDVSSQELEEQFIQPWNAWIGHIADDLAQSGFEISYLPMPLIYGKHLDYENRRDWFVLSYNNCLVEIGQSGSQVWMPTYGTGLANHSPFELGTGKLDDFDRQAEQCFRNLGFDVHRLMNYLPHMLYGGSVHCLTNCLLRDT
ncbi:MAG: hypothetical protein HUU01_09815 [Saprospiraceae bacterium]|nr:hypothetical protein [Saprospiraceae bacterium]